MHRVRLVELPKITDHRGSISFGEVGKEFPFEIKRIYYLYHTTDQANRGAHAHKTLQQVVIAISGSFDFILDDGHEKKTFRLDKPWQGLYVPTMLWRDITNFSHDSVCLVLASDHFTEDDYYRNYQEFLDAVKNQA